MSRTAEAVLEQFRKLSAAEQREHQLLLSLPTTTPQPDKPFPTVKVDDGPITCQQVAEALDDE